MRHHAEPDDGIPWGRRPIAAIPVPPFSSLDDALSFVRLLGLYVATLDGAGTVPLTSFALTQVLERERDALRGGRVVAPYPSAVVMDIAVSTLFPAPWTPKTANDAIRMVFEGTPPLGNDHQLHWGRDPSFSADRLGGAWTVTRSERGTDDLEAELPDDDAMVLYLLSRERRFGFPYGHVVRDAPIAAMDDAAVATRAAWASHASLPYLADWRK